MLTPKRVQAGQPFKPSASGWNALADYVRTNQGETGAGGPQPGDVTPTLTVLVRNDTGGDLPVRSVLKPGDPVLSAITLPHQVQAEPYFAAAAPGASTDPIVITAVPIKDGEVGRAVIVGVAVVEVAVSDAGHKFAEPIAATTARLASAATGPVRILWKDSGTGNKRAVVLLGGGGGGAAPAFSGARVYRTTLFLSVPNATDTIVPFEAELFDAGGYWSAGAPNQLVVPSTGYYLVGAHAAFTANATGLRIGYLRVAGAVGLAYANHQAPAAGLGAISLSTLVHINAGGAIELWVAQTSGGALNLETTSNQIPALWATRLG